MEKIELYYSDKTTLAPSDLEEMFNSLMKHIVSYMKLEGEITSSVTIVDNDTIQEINRDYRHIDRPTDVISFAYMESDSFDSPIKDLGEIVIALDVAKKQAIEFNHPLRRELAFLFIHGTLHLLGYDHVHSEEEANVMFELQNAILNSFKYDYLKEEM
ncbi:probable rRNA maturation factor [Clostridium sp. CAG:288]|jgi:metalloprotein, YbeY family|nr:probable rRNA maturation factor [Clostridium sp. CAG:288]